MDSNRNGPVDLPALTHKQMAFVHALLEGKSASDAYRGAYDCSDMADRSIWCEASKLRSNPKVAQWLRHYQRIGMDAAQMTIESHLAELARARELAIAHGQIAAGVQAENYRGKAAGLYEDQLRLTVALGDTDLVKAIEELFDEETSETIKTALGLGADPRENG
jgi:hypothetical protein